MNLLKKPVEPENFGKGGVVAVRLAEILNEQNSKTLANKTRNLLADYTDLLKQLDSISEFRHIEYLLRLTRADFEAKVDAGTFPEILKSHMKNYIATSFKETLKERKNRVLLENKKSLPKSRPMDVSLSADDIGGLVVLARSARLLEPSEISSFIASFKSEYAQQVGWQIARKACRAVPENAPKLPGGMRKRVESAALGILRISR